MAPLAPGRYGAPVHRSARARTTSCATPRPCSGTRSPPARSPRCSTAPWMRSSASSSGASSPRPTGRARRHARPARTRATSRPRSGARCGQRDGGQCTFVSAAGHRCEARTRLEFDHVEPVARGGRATVNGSEAAVPGPQPVRGRVRVRGRLHEPEARGGTARGGRGACAQPPPRRPGRAQPREARWRSAPRCAGRGRGRGGARPCGRGGGGRALVARARTARRRGAPGGRAVRGHPGCPARGARALRAAVLSQALAAVRHAHPAAGAVTDSGGGPTRPPPPPAAPPSRRATPPPRRPGRR